MEEFSKIMIEYNDILNDLVENAKSFENQIQSINEKISFLKRHENLSKALENVASKINNSLKQPSP